MNIATFLQLTQVCIMNTNYLQKKIKILYFSHVRPFYERAVSNLDP
jgi:hypothetical protein